MTIKATTASTPFIRVFDSNGQPIRRLWKRGHRYYAQVSIAGEDGRTKVKKVALEASTLPGAKIALARLLVDRADGNVALSNGQVKGPPTFKEFSRVFLGRLAGLNRRPRTTNTYTGALDRAHPFIGSKLLPDIRPKDIHALLRSLREQGYSPRSVNLTLSTTRGVLKEALQDEILKRPLATEDVSPVRADPYDRPLFDWEQIQAVADAAKDHRIRDLIIFLARSGCRVSEAVHMRWDQIDLESETITLGAIRSKGRRERTIHFNQPLREHLVDMHRLRIPNNPFLFPSHRSLRPMGQVSTQFRAARKKAGIDLKYHDLRRYFASWCCLKNVPVNVTASWLGHADGGKLLLKTYAKLNDQVLRDQARKLVAI